MSENNSNNVFINGKQQIIEMLRYMPMNERNKLISNIRLRNATMARELSEQSLSYSDLDNLDEDKLALVLRTINPAVIGLALYLSPRKFQRKCLGVLERTLAEKAYQIMTYDLSSKRTECERAQQKILQSAIELVRKNVINF